MSTKVKTLKVNKSSNTRTVKIKELLTLSQGLAYINSKETKVWHTISQNLDEIAPLVEKVNAKHRKLTEDLASKDEHGNPIRNEQNQIQFGDNMEEANKRWNKELDEEVEINLITIKLEDVKDYGLDANIMKPLLGILVIE